MWRAAHCLLHTALLRGTEHRLECLLTNSPLRHCAEIARTVTMASSSAEVIIVPRNFVLLGELEKAEKGNTDMSISYGLVTADDITLTDWQCTILGPQNCGVEGRIISLLIRCPPKYPIEMPHIQFQSKINYPWLVSGSRR